MPLPTDASLTCNFTIVSALNLSVSFQSGDTGNYGGQITLSTQGSEDPVTTQLWDNDGNVFLRSMPQIRRPVALSIPRRFLVAGLRTLKLVPNPV